MEEHGAVSKREQDKLKAEEDRYRFLLENSGDILWTIDLEGRWQFMTRNVEKVLHLKLSDVLGRTVWDFVAPECVPMLKDKLTRRLRGEKLSPYEVIVINGNRQRRPFEVVTTPIFDRSGKIVAIQGISRDISERKNAEEALRQSEKKFRDLVENIYDWVWEINSSGTFTYSSPRVRDYLGYAPDEIIGRSVYSLTDPERAKLIAGILDSLAKGRRKYVVAEKRLISKRGEPVDFEMNVSPVYNDDGTLRGFRGICRDIRERKRAEEALRSAYAELETRVKERTVELTRARATLQAILDTAPIGIVAADAATGNIAYYSRGAREMLGAPIMGNAYRPADGSYRLLKPDGSPYPAEELPLVLAIDRGKDVKDAEMLVRRPDGSERLIMASSAPIRDASGRITGAVASLVDITRLKSVENELREAKAQAELYLDLMSHDINNINMMAGGYMEMARQGITDNEAIVMLDRAIEMLRDSSQLIENVRKLQKAERRDLKVETVDLCDVARDVIEGYSTQPGRNVEISFHPPDGKMCPVMANMLLKDVFTNLIGNAIKHSAPDRPLAIDVRVTETSEDGTQYYRVTIEDNGPGIPDELKGRLFTRWQRGKTETGGKGLGLYLVRTLVEDYHGKVWAEDRVRGDYRQGTRFVLLLPALPGGK